MARNNDFYDNYFSYGLDPRRRRIFLDEDIDETSIGRFIQSLYVLADEQSQENAKPIEIIMSSFGGCEYEMFAAYDVIRSLTKVHVKVIAVGKIMSAAPLILAAGDESYCYPTTQFMVHESWYALEERHNNAKATVAHYEDMTKLWAEKMAERTQLTAKQWLNLTERTGRDKYFDAKAALKYGLVDGILMPDGEIYKGEE